MAGIKLTKERTRKIHAEYWHNGVSIADVAKRHKVHTTTLRDAFTRYGLPRRPQGTNAFTACPEASEEDLRQREATLAEIKRLDAERARRLRYEQ